MQAQGNDSLQSVSEKAEKARQNAEPQGAITIRSKISSFGSQHRENHGISQETKIGTQQQFLSPAKERNAEATQCYTTDKYITPQRNIKNKATENIVIK